MKLYEKYPTASVQLLYHEPSDDVIDEPIGKIREKYVSKTWKNLKPAENTSATERGFVELPAKTGASWILLDKIILEVDCEFETCRVVVEYKTVFGNQKVIAVFASKEGVRYLNRDYKVHRQELLKRTGASSPPKSSLKGSELTTDTPQRRAPVRPTRSSNFLEADATLESPEVCSAIGKPGRCYASVTGKAGLASGYVTGYGQCRGSC